jgi:hypothetical protein
VIIQDLTGNFFNLWNRDLVQVGHMSASNTPNVRVAGRVSVIPALRPGGFQLLNRALFRQDFQVSIDRAEAYTWKPMPYDSIHLVRGRMGVDLLDFLQDDPALPGHSLMSYWNISQLSIHNDNHYQYKVAETFCQEFN